MKQWIIVWLATMVAVMLLVPALALSLGPLSSPLSEENLVKLEAGSGVVVPVYLSKEKRIAKLPLEEYVRGVVAAEMPVTFELEALKAQALVARTYIMRRIAKGDFSHVPAGAYVTDTVQHQAHLTEQELKDRWGTIRAQLNLSKINEAVNATKGQILVYEGEPINATFFSTSNGYTENSEDYWNATEPYLRSVASPWDTQSPKFMKTVRVRIDDFERRLGVRLSKSSLKNNSFMKVIAQSEGKRIAKVKVGGKTLTGREIREKLELASSHFSWKVDGDEIIFTTKGYGHGVGMSQYGAQGMALEGKSYKEIVKHYYRGVDVVPMDKIEIAQNN
jgi:stage II sporulation protein D